MLFFCEIYHKGGRSSAVHNADDRKNMEYTYLLLHPSSIVFVEQIFSTLKQNNITIAAVYRISYWDAILNDIYKNTYAKSATIEAHVQSHAYINKYMFGNCGLILLLHKNIPYDELVKETINVKFKLRQSMNKTKDGTITILHDVSPSTFNLSMDKATLTHQDEKILKIFLSYVHCPDTIEQYIEDFKILRDYLKNELTPQEIEGIIKYRSFYYKIEAVSETLRFHERNGITNA